MTAREVAAPAAAAVSAKDWIYAFCGAPGAPEESTTVEPSGRGFGSGEMPNEVIGPPVVRAVVRMA